MPAARFAVAVLTAAFLSACTGGSDATPGPRLDPPDGTGELTIDMRGVWIATSVEVFEQNGGVPTPPAPPTRMYPPVVGSTVEIGESGFVDLDGAPVASLCVPNQYTERFAGWNQQNGRFAFLDIGCRTRPDPRIADGGSSRIQCAFGSIAEDQMLGYVRIEVIAAPLPPEVPRSGLYRVILARR